MATLLGSGVHRDDARPMSFYAFQIPVSDAHDFLRLSAASCVHTPFVTCRNQLSIGVLLDAQGQVANHVGVLCEVNQMPPAMFHKLLHR